MSHRTVADVMTRNVATASPEASLKTVARSLDDNGVSALPVVDTRRHPIGIISRSRPAPQASRAARYRRARAPAHHGADGPCLHGSPDRRRSDVHPVLTARPEWGIVETARFLHERGVKRLPVVDGTGTLVGIVSRTDLLRPMLRRDEIVDDVLGRTLRMTPGGVAVTVSEGVVSLSGQVEERSAIPVAERLWQSVDGVFSMDQALGYAVDDLSPVADPRRATH